MIILKSSPFTQTALGLLRPLAVILVLFWLFAGVEARAATAHESLDRIGTAALDHVRSQLPAGARLSAGTLDQRLRLAACPEPLAAAGDAGTGASVSVEVRCVSRGWKLYVPVAVSVQVPVLVAARGLNRGDVAGLADVEVQQRDRAGLGASWLSDPQQLEGLVVARAVSAGSVLMPAQFSLARLVRRGQSVTLLGQAASFQVRAQGKALGDAAAGELVRVENLSSRRVVQGRVLADGSVQVGL
jgi:flagella basal body P-ring formation protein FlgA